MADFVIRGARIVSVDPTQPPVFTADIHFHSDGLIVAVGEKLEAPPGSEVIDGTGMIAMPGLVDAHRHQWQHLLRGISTDHTVIEYRSKVRAAYGGRYRPADVYAATLIADLEALNSGVTTVADLAHIMNSPEHADAAIQAHRHSGLRVLFSHGVPNDDDAASWWSASQRRHPDDIRRLRDVLADDDSLVTLGMFMRPPFLVTAEVLAHDLAVARELGVHVSIDGGVGGGCWDTKRWGDEGLTPALDLLRLGELGPHITLVHCNNLPPEEFELIARHGANIAISPDHEMHCGHGLPATKDALGHGIEPALSIDSVVAVSGDMFAAMRTLLTATRGAWADRAYRQGTAVDSWTLTTSDVVRFATVRGAAACGMAGRLGALSPGMKADIVLLRSDPLNLTLLNDPVAALVTTVHPGNVDTVIVNGAILKRDGRLLHAVDGVISAAESARAHVMGASSATPNVDSTGWSVFA